MTRWFLRSLGADLPDRLPVAPGADHRADWRPRNSPGRALSWTRSGRLRRRAWLRLPTCSCSAPSDALLKLACIAGAIAALAVIIGVARRAALLVVFVLYLSLVPSDRLSSRFNGISCCLKPASSPSSFCPLFSRVWIFRWLLFRLMFLSGTAKLLSHDPAWRNLTALAYHYQTQPLPTRFAWYFHHFPADFQKISCLFVFFVELVVPFLLFAPRRVRFFAGTMTVALQALIFITGNYAFFNLLAVALCLSCLMTRCSAGYPPNADAGQKRRHLASEPQCILFLHHAGELSSSCWKHSRARFPGPRQPRWAGPRRSESSIPTACSR